MKRSGLSGIESSRPRMVGSAAVGSDESRLMGLLGLPAADQDPVTIITAAQVRLRRWRRVLNSGWGERVAPDALAVNDRIRRITAARDTLLRQAFLSDVRVVRN
jgi:hypothetical protein